MEENKTPQQKYYEANKEKIAAQRKARYETNKEYFKVKNKTNYENNKEYHKEYQKTNKEKLKEYQKEYRKEYYENNKETILEKNNLWRQENYDKEQRKINYEVNKDIIKIKQKEYYKKNKQKRNEYTKTYNKIRYHNDPLFNLKQCLRNLIYKSIKRKGGVKVSKTELILGCSYGFFKSYIENLWLHSDNLDENGNVWMTWENKGNPKDGILGPNKSWDIDHKIPITNGKTVDEVIKLNHYNNLQPMCSYYNRHIKGVN
jgi:hypothetical protein